MTEEIFEDLLSEPKDDRDLIVARPANLEELTENTSYYIEIPAICGKTVIHKRILFKIEGGKYEFIRLDGSDRTNPLAINSHLVDREDITIKNDSMGYNYVSYRKCEQTVYNVDLVMNFQDADDKYQERFLMLRQRGELRLE